MQLAETIARGRILDGFQMPGKRQKVLYVDMVTSDARLSERYSYRDRGRYTAMTYSFSNNLYRHRPPKREQLIEWLRTMIKKGRLETVIIDDIGAFSRTCYGTSETLAVMRGLKDLTDEFGTSILVLMSTPAPTRDPLISEADLKRWSALADVCDSVFGLGFHPRVPGSRYLLQTRSRHGRKVWNEHNAPVSTIGNNDANMLAHLFDGRFAAAIGPEQRVAICRIKALRAGGLSFRKIAERLNLPVTRVRRWFDLWKPEMEVKTEAVNQEAPTQSDEPPAQAEIEAEEWDEAEFEKPPWIDEEQKSTPSAVTADAEAAENSGYSRIDAARIPFAAATRRRTVNDLEFELNDYGRPRYVEERWNNGRPRIFYERQKDGRLIKRVACGPGYDLTDLGKTDFL
jgi:hypothetical protein